MDRTGEPLITTANLRLIAVLWVFNCALIDILAALGGRTTLGVMFIANAPLCALGALICTGLALTLAWSERLAPYKRWPLMALALALASVVQSAVDLSYFRLLALTIMPDWQAWALVLSTTRFGTVVLVYTWTFMLALSLVWASRVNDISQMNAARAAAFEAATLRAEANALRLQLNPHFLFNTLNSIASLTVTGRKAKAETMIHQLADFLRSSFASDPTGGISLKDEVATVLAYLKIEETRFGDRMVVETDIDPEVADTIVPNFILQPLAENAVKYGVAPHRRPVRLTVSARREGQNVVIAITDLTAGETELRRPPTTSHGLGLRNVRQRLDLAYAGAGWLMTTPLANGYRAEVGVPFTAARQPGELTVA